MEQELVRFDREVSLAHHQEYHEFYNSTEVFYTSDVTFTFSCIVITIELRNARGAPDDRNSF